MHEQKELTLNQKAVASPCAELQEIIKRKLNRKHHLLTEITGVDLSCGEVISLFSGAFFAALAFVLSLDVVALYGGALICGAIAYSLLRPVVSKIFKNYNHE